MNKHVDYLYRCHFAGVKVKQSWWQRLKGRITNHYEITIVPPYNVTNIMNIGGQTYVSETRETTKYSIVLGPYTSRWKI